MDHNYATMDISDELWREVEIDGRTYRIDNPVTLVTRRGGSTHRVIDREGVVHCYAAPEGGRSVIRWKSREGKPPVKF